MSAQQLQVLDAVLATAARDDVAHLQDTERELAATSVAPAFLLTEQHVLVLPVGNQSINVRALGNAGHCLETGPESPGWVEGFRQ